MPQDLWTNVDHYISDSLIQSDAALDAALSASTAAGLPAIAVSPAHGKLLHLLAKIRGARRILEIGTLGGYSTIWLARALPPDGQLITLEADSRHAAVARANIDRAGVGALVDVRIGLALDTLPMLASEPHDPFDFTFIDADKQNIPAYFEWALRMSRSGSVIVVDNVVRDGAVIDAESTDRNVVGVRRFNEMVKAEPRVSATAIQTVGIKGYDGFCLALVVA